MGPKITIDSATMVNKTFEIIEAHYLFGYGYNDIQIKLNLNSYVHSIVLYKDGTYRLDAGKPDMRVPIKYALYQGLIPYQTIVTDDLDKIENTTFARFDIRRFPIVSIAERVINEKGTLGAIFNAANEEAVKAFLDGKLPFLGIERMINRALKNIENKLHPDYLTLKQVDQETRLFVNKIITKGDN